jgi:hypothetical protein
MKLRLWASWVPAAEDAGVAGYHLELDRGYARVPAAGESIQLRPTRHGIGKRDIEHVFWDDAAIPNLLLGTWDETEGFELTELTEAGFHQSDDAVSGCVYCGSTLERKR